MTRHRLTSRKKYEAGELVPGFEDWGPVVQRERCRRCVYSPAAWSPDKLWQPGYRYELEGGQDG